MATKKTSTDEPKGYAEAMAELEAACARLAGHKGREGVHRLEQKVRVCGLQRRLQAKAPDHRCSFQTDFPRRLDVADFITDG